MGKLNRYLFGVLAAVSLLLGSCGSSSDDNELSVFAAASLAEVMDELVAAYTETSPGVNVAVNLAGSTTLKAQIFEGAPADVVLLANQATMSQLVDEDAVQAPQLAAANRMVLAVPADNPGGVKSLDDLARSDLLIGLCDSQVPCGATARNILDAAGVVASPDTNEPDVKSLVAKIVSGELDAGIVYTTDLASAGDELIRIDIDPSLYEPNVYPVAVVTDGDKPAEAQLFIDFVLSERGQSVLAASGFLPAEEVN